MLRLVKQAIATTDRCCSVACGTSSQHLLSHSTSGKLCGGAYRLNHDCCWINDRNTCQTRSRICIGAVSIAISCGDYNRMRHSEEDVYGGDPLWLRLSSRIFNGLLAGGSEHSIERSSLSTVINAASMQYRRYSLPALPTMVPTILASGTMKSVMDSTDLRNVSALIL